MKFEIGYSENERDVKDLGTQAIAYNTDIITLGGHWDVFVFQRRQLAKLNNFLFALRQPDIPSRK